MTKATRTSGQGGGRLLAAVSALFSGVLGWLLAHACTDWLLSRAGHHHGNPAVHGHLHLPAAVMLTACLAGGSVLAVFVAAVAGRPPADPGRYRSQRSAARRSSLLSTAVANRSQTRWMAAEPARPATLLYIGGVIASVFLPTRNGSS